MKSDDFTLEMLVKYLRVLGHDVRAPLGSLISTSDMLLTGAYEPLNAKQQRAAERIARTGRRTLAIIDDFITFIKAKTDELLLNHEPFSPRKCLDDCCKVVEPAALAKGLTFSQTTEGLPETFTGDAALTGRILTALLWNAVAFTEEGAITLRSTWSAQDGLQIRVTDTGCGLAADDLPHIFEPFWRGIQRPQVPTAGAGLGLPLAQALAQALGGAVTLEQTSPSGSTFLVVLPEPPSP